MLKGNQAIRYCTNVDLSLLLLDIAIQQNRLEIGQVYLDQGQKRSKYQR